MKKKLMSIIAIVLSILIPLQSFTFAKAGYNTSAANKKTVLVKYKNNNLNNNSNKGIRSSESISSQGVSVKKNLRNKNVKVVEATDQTIEQLRKDNNVLYVEDDSTVKKSDDKVTWNIEKVKATELQRRNYSGKGIKVAVFDTGIDTGNTDLNIVGGVSFVNGVTSYSDDNGHGTAMAGILSSLKNSKGYLGVAPEIDLYSVKVLDKNGEGKYSSIIDGLQWAIDNKVNIVSMSLGGMQYSKILQEAINEAYSHNILIIAASGNDGNLEQVDFPASYKNVICVGAVDENNDIASFSNRGTQMDVVAPGVSIEATGLNNENQIISGTSAAVSHVSGIAAEVWSAKKTITNKQLRNILLGSAKSLGEHNTYGYGLVNGEECLKNLNKTLNIPEKAEITSGIDSGSGGTVHSSLIKYSGDNQHIKLGENAVLGLQYSASHNNIEVTIKRGSETVSSEVISARGEDPYGYVEYYTCKSDILNKTGTYTVRFHCPDYQDADEIFTIYVEEKATDPTDPSVEKPTKPTGLSLEPHSNYIIASWNSVSNADSYNVEVDGGSSITAVDPSCVSDTLTPNTRHTIKVRAVNSAGESEWSDEISVYTLASVPVKRQGILDGKIVALTVSWQDNGNPNGTLYKLGLFDENGGLLKENTWTTNLEDTFGRLNYCTTYIVKIKVKNFADVESDWYQFGTETVPPRSQCDNGLKEGQYGYHNTDTQVCVNEPVNIITGNYYDNEEDLNISDIGLPLQIQRSYNSIDSKTGIIGKSWRMNYESSISVDSVTGNVRVTYTDGHVGSFTAKSGGNEFISPEGMFEQLTKESNGVYILKKKDKSAYRYNSDGKLISISDRNNNTVTLTYDGLGQIKTVTGQGGKKLTFSFENGRLKSITDQANRTISYYYDAAGNLTKVKGLGGGEKNYTYNTYGLVSITDENNKKFIENEYDKYNRIIKQYDENRNEITYTYDEKNQETTCYYKTSDITEKYKYNDNLYVTKITYSDNTYEEYTFDQWGNKDSIRDRNGNVTAYEYDQRGNLKTVTSAAPFFYKTSYVYDENDNLKQITSPGGAETSCTYDEKGNVKSVTNKLDENTNAVTTYGYDANGRVTSITDAENNATTFEYSDSPSPIKIVGPENETISYTYDSLNRKITCTDAKSTVTYHYNDRDKVEKIVDGLNNVTRLKYDKLGNLVKIIKPEQYSPSIDDGLGITYEYDAMDRKVKAIDPVGAVNALKYDEFGNVIKEINPNYYNGTTDDGIGYGYTYDSNKRLTKVTNPSGKKSRIKYDAVGNKIKEIDANNYNEATDDGAGIEYVYDQLNRLITVKDTNGNVVKKLIYNANGNITKEIDGKGYLSGNTDESRYGTLMKYNLAGWLTEQRKAVKNQNGSIYYNITRYLYNKNGLVLEKKTSQEYVTASGEPSAWNTVTNTYNKSGKIKKVTDSLGEVIEYDYNSAGQIEMESSLVNEGNSSKIYYTYNNLGKVETVKREILSKDLANGDTGNNVTYAVTSFEYDKNGNITSVKSPEGYVSSYVYDAAGRLKNKKEEVTSNTITTFNTTVSVNTEKAAVLPGEQVDYQIKIKPDREVSGMDLYLEYDERICKFEGLKQEIEGISVDGTTPGKIRISGSQIKINKETILATLNFKIKEGVSGKGYITINSLSTYKDSKGNKLKFSEGSGKVVSGKTLDMNNDGKVETNDFTIMAKNSGATSYDLSYEEKYDIDGNGKIDAFDLNYMKDYLFSNNQSSAQLNTLNQAKFYEKFSNAVYTDKENKEIRQTSYEYDKAGNLIREEYSNGTVVYKYDAYNRLISVTDKANNVTRAFYDEVGNVTKEVLPENYNSDTDNGTGTQYIYDTMNRLVEVRDSEGNVLKRNIYDVNGLVTKSIDAKGYLASTNDSGRYGIEYSYDIGNRVETVTTPESKSKGKISSSYIYDAMGNAISYTDGEQNTTTYTRDMWGKITSVTDPYGVDTKYDYDKAGNLSAVTDGNNNRTTYTYNSMNKLAVMQDALNQKVLYKYDKEGRLTQQTDRNGQNILYEYNSDGNVTNRSIAGKDEQQRFLYNMDGSLLAAITASGVDTFSYTSNDQLLTKSRNGKEILKYDYDKNGNVLSVTDQTGQATGYRYDINNKLKTVLDGNTTVATYNYNVDQTLSSVNYKNGLDVSYTYDKDNNVTSLVQKNSKGKEINNFAYTYDNNGNQLSKNENGSTTTYTYDKLNRLLTAGTDSFTYDKAGNRKTWKKLDESITYNYDSNNRLTEATSSKKGSTVYTYDNNGNQLTSSDGTKYTYDGFNQLKTAILPDGTWMENEYDAFGLRVSVCENGLSSEFTYDRGSIITETNGSNKLVSRSIRGYGLIARKNSAGTLAYYLNNVHGDVSKLVNENGDVLNSYEYDAFGNTTSCTEKVQNRFQYTGEQFDKVTGQYYLRARYYDPATGRFATEDTYRGQIDDTMSLNLYNYCQNNPVMYVDPSGHKRKIVRDVVGDTLKDLAGYDFSINGIFKNLLMLSGDTYDPDVGIYDMEDNPTEQLTALRAIVNNLKAERGKINKDIYDNSIKLNNINNTIKKTVPNIKEKIELKKKCLKIALTSYDFTKDPIYVKQYKDILQEIDNMKKSITKLEQEKTRLETELYHSKAELINVNTAIKKYSDWAKKTVKKIKDVLNEY